jgi:hypothetical protein
VASPRTSCSPQIILEGRSNGPCFDPSSPRLAFQRGRQPPSQCTTLSADSPGFRLLFVSARRLTLRNLVLTGASARDTFEGGCLRVNGDVVIENVAFMNCSARFVRIPYPRRPPLHTAWRPMMERVASLRL